MLSSLIGDYAYDDEAYDSMFENIVRVVAFGAWFWCLAFSVKCWASLGCKTRGRLGSLTVPARHAHSTLVCAPLYAHHCMLTLVCAPLYAHHCMLTLACPNILGFDFLG